MADQPEAQSILSGNPALTLPPQSVNVTAPNPAQEPLQSLPITTQLIPPPATPSAALSGPAPGSFGAKLAAAANKLSLVGKPGVGSWARQLVGGAMEALTGIGDSAEAGHDLSPGQGAATGIAKTMAARTQRLQTEQAIADKQKQQSIENARQQGMDQAQIDELHARTLLSNIQRENAIDVEAGLGPEQIEKTMATGKAALASLEADLGAQPAQKITYDQWKADVQKNPALGQDHEAFVTDRDPATGKALVSVVDITGNHTLTPEDKTLFKNNLDKFKDLDVSQIQNEISKSDYLKYVEAIRNKQTVDAVRAHDLADLKSQAAKDAANADATDFMGSPEFMKYLNASRAYSVDKFIDPKSPGTPDLFTAVSLMEADPKAQAQFKADHPGANLHDTLMAMFGTGEDKDGNSIGERNFESLRKDHYDQQSKMLDIREKAIDTANAKTGFIGTPGLTGPAFLNSLTDNERGVVEDIGSGRMPISRFETLLRSKDGQALAEAVANAYPDSFDGSKIDAFKDITKQFTSGQASDTIRAASAALTSLQKYNSDLGIWARNPLTSASQKLDADARDAANAIATVYANGKTPSPKQIDDVFNNLTTYGSRSKAAASQGQNVMDRINGYVDQWDSAAPSESYRRQIPVNLDPQAVKAAQSLGVYPATDVKKILAGVSELAGKLALNPNGPQMVVQRNSKTGEEWVGIPDPTTGVVSHDHITAPGEKEAIWAAQAKAKQGAQ